VRYKENGVPDDLCNRTAITLSALLTAGKVSSAELIQAAIARIELLGGPINAIVCRRSEDALLNAQDTDVAHSDVACSRARPH
jgi:Asp-tRNA(Asn)/Glu-tRNA(Gln) amidotransferase A subunit family amidase